MITRRICKYSSFVLFFSLFGMYQAAAQNFGIIPPRIVKRLSGVQGTTEVKYALMMANKYVDRPPSPLTRIHVEGTMPHQGIMDASIAGLQELNGTRDMALAYRLTGDKKYLNQVEAYVDAWVSTYQISFNPIDESGFDVLIIADDLCRADFPPALQAKVDGFLRNMVEGYISAIAALKKPDTANWQSHRIKLITLGAFALNDPRLIQQAKALFETQVAANILPDGSTVDFAKRDALHYVCYDLEPLLMAADSAYVHGQDWFHWQTPSGSSLADAVQWLVPYADGEKTHVEFVHTTVPFDKQRMQAGVAEFTKTWDPKESLKTFGLAAAMDPKFRTVVDQLRARPGYYVNHWIVLAIWP